MVEKCELEWSEPAFDDLEKIYNFLLITWTTREAENFLDLVIEFEELLLRYPKLFATSKKFRSCRIGMIHENISAVYKIMGKKILIVALVDNRSKSKYR